MADQINAKNYGLAPQTLLEKDNKGNIYLVIDRKSRIIMADGKKIIEKAKKILLKEPGAKIILKTSAPVCSKTVSFLQEHGITLAVMPKQSI